MTTADQDCSQSRVVLRYHPPLVISTSKAILNKEKPVTNVKYEYDNVNKGDLTESILTMLPVISLQERIRIASSILIVTTDRNDGDLTMKVETDKHLYTITVSREELSE